MTTPTNSNQLLGQLYDTSFVSFTTEELLEALGAPEGATLDIDSVRVTVGSFDASRFDFDYYDVDGEFRYLIPGGYTKTNISADVTVDGVTTEMDIRKDLESALDFAYDVLTSENSVWAEIGDSRNATPFDESNATRPTSFSSMSFRGIESDYFVVLSEDEIPGVGRPILVAIPEANIGDITSRAVYEFTTDPRTGGYAVRVNDFEGAPGVIDFPSRTDANLTTQALPNSVFEFASGDSLGSYLNEQGAGYFRKVGDFFVPVDEGNIQTEADLKNLYFCDPAVSTDPVAQFMDPNTGDIAPTLGGNTPPREAYDGTSAIERYCVCVDELPFFEDPTVPFEGYDPINNWQPQRRLEINPGGPAAEPLGDELVINDARGRLFGLNNRASDGTFDELTGVAFVMGAEGAFDDGTIAGKEYIGTLEFDLQEGYRTTANFNNAQLSPIMGSVSADGTLDGALVDTETGAVMALFENVNVL